ncbi:MAG: hypothetical protein HY785_06590 [Oscillatoriophycideae cyanobacterium NC_groundwater_1537_Pr4_S-0.65um_50_18]|nr:hypothetical protein [Oscillatoriophycideae cyanobacterium NC_groundwater_1537_Pr4_S-0.65um_50_18]
MPLGDLIEGIQSTPIPTMLIVAGLFILILAFVTKIGGMIEVSSEQKRWAIPIGLFVLVMGLVLNFSSAPITTVVTPSPSAPSSPTQVKPIGWIRLGAIRDASGNASTGEPLIATTQPVTITPMQVPAINDQVEVISGVNVRVAYPKPPDYQLQDQVSVLTANQKIVILEIKAFADQKSSTNSTVVWARVGLP